MAWIKFKDKDEEVKALYDIFIKHRINCVSYTDGVHNIPEEGMNLLDEKNITQYEKLKDQEVIATLEGARKLSIA